MRVGNLDLIKINMRIKRNINIKRIVKIKGIIIKRKRD